MNLLDKLEQFYNEKKITQELRKILTGFYTSYKEAALQNKKTGKKIEQMMLKLLNFTLEQIKSPYNFEIYHQCIRSPVDYYSFALNFFRMIIQMESSEILGRDNLHEINEIITNGENVILFANHQTEPDPQAISVLLESCYPKLAEELIMVAGHRVITDPVAMPFSVGTNLLCIHSKNYIEHPKDEKHVKLVHNRKTMKKMVELLSMGGKLIYVAPSGGRDRKNKSGQITISPFDPQSVEMFWLMAGHAKKKTHFFPLSLKTHDLMPPPDVIKIKLGEKRLVNLTPVFLSFGKKIDMHKFENTEDRKIKRQLRAKHIEQKVLENYKNIEKRG